MKIGKPKRVVEVEPGEIDEPVPVEAPDRGDAARKEERRERREEAPKSASPAP